MVVLTVQMLIVCKVGAAATVTVAEPLIPLPATVAVMVAVPAPAPAVALPLPSIATTLVSDESQVTALLMSCVELSEYVPVAVNCCVPPPTSAAVAGPTSIDFKVGAAPETVTVAEPLMP